MGSDGATRRRRPTMRATSSGRTAGELEAIAACASYAFCSVSLSLCNKLVFSGKNFDYPMAILTFQSLCAVIFLKGGDLVGLSKPMPLQRDLFVAMAPVTLLFCAMLWTSGKALRFCSMPLFTVFKNMAVVGTTTWEYFRFGNTVSMGAMFSLLMMVGGSVVAGYGDMTATMEGMFWLMANVVVTVAYLATLKERMPTDVSSSSKTLHNNVLTLMLFVVSSAATGELMPFCTQLSRQPARMQLGVLMTGVLGTAINMSTFWCMHVTSGATYAFVGATNKIPVAILGHFLFHSVLTPSGWMGVGFGLAAGLVYAVAKERERQLKDASAIADGAQREREHLLGENTDDAASPGKPVATRVAGGVAAAPDGPEADVELGRLGAGTVRGGEDDDLR